MSWSVTGTSKTSTTVRVSVAVVVVLTGLRGAGVGAGRLTVVRLVEEETVRADRPLRDVVLAAPDEATVRAGAEAEGAAAAVLSALLADTTVLVAEAQPDRPRQARAGRVRMEGVFMGGFNNGNYWTTGLALTTWVTTDLTLSTP
jgi:hypothetical protein